MAEAAAHDLVSSWRAFHDAFERGDDRACLERLQRWIRIWDRCFWARDLEPFRSVYAPDVQFHAHLPMGDREAHGVDELLALREEISEVASFFLVEIREFRRSGDRFAGLGLARGRSRYTRLVVRFRVGIVWTVADGLITSAEVFASRRGAVRALSG